MKRVTAIATATVLALFVALTLNAAAQQPDTRDLTIMTFSSAFELPGMRLEPGTYVFQLADTPSRNVIQLFDKERKHMMGQWLFASAVRPDVTGDTVVTFRETSAASTPAVQYWYYPGKRIGKEFIYPKGQALRIAQRTGATVLTKDGPVTATAEAQVAVAPAETASASISTDSGIVEGAGLPDEAQAETTQAEAPVATSGSGEPGAVGTSGRGDQVATDSGVRQESTIARADTDDSGAVSELPATASPLALSGLLSLLSLAGAAGIRSFRL